MGVAKQFRADHRLRLRLPHPCSKSCLRTAAQIHNPIGARNPIGVAHHIRLHIRSHVLPPLGPQLLAPLLLDCGGLAAAFTVQSTPKRDPLKLSCHPANFLVLYLITSTNTSFHTLTLPPTTRTTPPPRS